MKLLLTREDIRHNNEGPGDRKSTYIFPRGENCATEVVYPDDEYQP